MGKQLRIQKKTSAGELIIQVGLIIYIGVFKGTQVRDLQAIDPKYPKYLISLFMGQENTNNLSAFLYLTIVKTGQYDTVYTAEHIVILMVLLYKELRIRLISNKRGGFILKRPKASTLPAKLGSLLYKISTSYTDFGRGDLTILLKVRISQYYTKNILIKGCRS